MTAHLQRWTVHSLGRKVFRLGSAVTKTSAPWINVVRSIRFDDIMRPEHLSSLSHSGIDAARL